MKIVDDCVLNTLLVWNEKTWFCCILLGCRFPCRKGDFGKRDMVKCTKKGVGGSSDSGEIS